MIIRFTYTNHRGEKAARDVRPLKLEYIPRPGYNYEPGWFLTALDVDKNAIRSFALQNIEVSHKGVNIFTLLEFPNG